MHLVFAFILLATAVEDVSEFKSVGEVPAEAARDTRQAIEQASSVDEENAKSTQESMQESNDFLDK